MSDLTSEQLDELESHAKRTVGTPEMDNHIVVLAPDMLAIIDQARRAEAAERERDALREELETAVEWAEDGPGGCFSCVPDDAPDGARHEDWCWVVQARAALAEPTDTATAGAVGDAASGGDA